MRSVEVKDIAGWAGADPGLEINATHEKMLEVLLVIAMSSPHTDLATGVETRF